MGAIMALIKRNAATVQSFQPVAETILNVVVFYKAWEAPKQACIYSFALFKNLCYGERYIPQL